MFLDFLGNFIHRQHYYYVAKIPEAACLTPTRPYLPLDLSPSFLASSLFVVGIIFSRAGRTSPCCLSALSPSLITSASTSFSACPQSSSPAALCPPPSSPSRVFPWCPGCQPLYSMPLLGSMAVAAPAISLVADLAPTTSPRWISSGRRDAASYTSCGSLVLALALGHGAAAVTTLLRVAPSTCSMKYCSELQLDLHSPCATSQTPLVVDVVLRASSVRRKSQVHGQHIHNSNPIGQVV